MAEITEILTADAGGFAAGMREAASAADEAAAQIEAAFGRIKAGLDGAGGTEKLTASMDAAAASIEAAVARISASLEKISASADSAAGGIDRVGSAADAAAGGMRDASGAADEFAVAMDRQAEAADRAAVALDRQAAAGDRAGKASEGASAGAGRTAKAILLGTAAVAAYGIDLAAKLQTQVTRLYTSAGESQKNLPMIQSGILRMSGQTATSQSDLASGAYMIESAGFHGQDALSVLKASAEGAKAEGAPLGEVGNALTSLLNAYGLKKNVPVATQATQAMDQIIAMVGQGKMTMAGAVSALPNVLPVAAKAGLSFGQVGGSLAQMTSMGMSPDQASQNLAHAIGALSGPSHVQTLEMQQLGLNSVKLSQNLGKEGLTGAISQVETAIMSNMGPAGTVLLHSFNSSKLAAASARQEIAAMPAPLQKVASAYMDNAMSTKAYRAELQSLPPLQANVLKQFAATADAAHGFNNQLKAGGGNAQTFVDALSKAMGGQTGRNVALMLGGQSMPDTVRKVNAVTAAGKAGGTDVTGWDQIQKTAAFQFSSLKNSLEAAATAFGAVLLPAATKAASILADAGRWLADHSTASKFAAGLAGALSAAALGKKLFSGVESSLSTIGKIGATLHIPGLDKLANIGQDTGLAKAGTGLDGAAGALKAAAADLSAAAEKLAGEGGLPGKGKVPGEGEPVPPVPGESPPSLFERLGVPIGETLPLAIAAGVSIAGQKLNPHDYHQQLTSLQKSNKPSQEMPVLGPLKKDLIDSWALPLLSGLGAAGTGLGRQFQAMGSYISGGVTRDLHNAASFFGFGGGKPAPAPAAPAPAESQMPHMLSVAGHAGTATGGLSAAAAKIPQPDLSGITAGKVKAMAELNAIGTALKPAKIPAPDMTGPEQAKTKAMQDMAGISQALSTGAAKPAKVAAPDLSGVETAKGRAQAAAQNIWSAVQQPLAKPVKAAAPDISAFAAARGPAASDGSAISAGLASGILAGEGAVVAAAQQVAAAATAAMKSALQTHSPSKVTEVIGEDYTGGFVKGVTKAKAKAKSAAIDLSATTVNSLVTGLQGGQSAVDAAMTALGSPAKPQDITTITSTVAKLQTELQDALKKGDISKSEDSALTKWLAGDSKKLQALAAKRTMLETEISSSQQIAQSVISGASILNAGAAQPTESITAQSSYQTVQGMQYQAQQSQQFAAQLAQLKSQGLNATELNQLAQGGAQAGLPVTEGLVGNQGAISQLNASQQQITAAAGKIGDIGGVAGYQSGQQIMAQTAKGLKSQLSQVDAAMKSVAASMVDGVKAAVSGKGLEAAMKAAGQSAGQGFASGLQQEIPQVQAAAKQLAQAAEQAAKGHLKARSPSLLFRDIGLSMPAGLAEGMGAGTGLVAASAARLAAASHQAYSQHPAVAQAQSWSGGGSRGGDVHVHMSVTVQGNVTSERDLLTSLQGLQLDRAINNWRGGMSMPGKTA